MPYAYSIYSFQFPAQSAAAQEAIDRMERDGWQVHTAIPNYTEVAILWFKPPAPPQAETPAEPEHVIAAPRQDPSSGAWCVACSCGWFAAGEQSYVASQATLHPGA